MERVKNQSETITLQFGALSNSIPNLRFKPDSLFSHWSTSSAIREIIASSVEQGREQGKGQSPAKVKDVCH